MPTTIDARAQAEVLARNTAEVIPQDELHARLERSAAEGRPLRVKLGIDPSRPDLHLGHTVVLRKLRQFQDFGHTAVLIIGDLTGRVGDPSGQPETRPFLSPEEIEANAATYLDQAGLVLDVERAEIRRNSEWLAGLAMADVLRLAAGSTVARMLERDDFQARYREGRPISVVEFLYPLMQAMDSVAVRADVEMGGTDQTFNLLVGRDIQRQYGQEPQVVLTMPLLEGTDGSRKMSKSLDNYVGLTDSPDEMFGKLMRVPDELIVKYRRLCTPVGDDEAEEIERGLAEGRRHPAEEKRRLARDVVDLYHAKGAGAAAEERFDAVHRDQRILDTDIEARSVSRTAVFRVDGLHVPSLLRQLGLASSNSEGLRLVRQEGIRARFPGRDEHGERIAAEYLRPGPGYELEGSIWTVGRRRSVRLERFTE